MNILKNIKLINTNKLIPYINNPKKHPDEQIKKLAESIKEFGFTVPIIVNEDNEIISGHGRFEAAKYLDLDKIPVIIRDDLSESQVRAFRIADNKLAESEWSLEQLTVEMEVLNLDDYDLDFTGFNEKELNDMGFEEEYELSDSNDENESNEVEKVERKTYLRTLSHNLGAYHINYLSGIDKKALLNWKDNKAEKELERRMIQDFIDIYNKRPGFFECVTVPPPSSKREGYKDYPIVEVAKKVATEIDKPFQVVFKQKEHKTRRSKHGRLETSQKKYELETLDLYNSYLVIDDVSTTGSTFQTVQATFGENNISCFMIAWCFWGH